MKIDTKSSSFGNMIYISQNDVTLGITTQYGMRISYISAFGSDNICYCDDVMANYKPLDDGNKWFNLGGHRLWKSPEDNSCYVDDNNPCECHYDNRKLVVTNNHRSDSMVYSIRIEFTGHNTVKLTHTITNCSDSDVRLALWAITALKSTGTVVLPLDTTTQGLLPNRNIVYWPYSNILDNRISMRLDGIAVKANKAKPLKIGTFTSAGYIAYENYDVIMKKSFKVEQGEYPDMQCNIECYTDENVMEIESVSPLYTLYPFEQKSYIEHWTFTRK
ncbi:MAG: hypothetical protein PHW00_02370 [Clostridia bacterium]|nr:hypothetical protein [Clostridia bacterium]